MWRPDTHGWTQQQELAAQQIEVVDAWSRVLYQTIYMAHSGGKKPKMPPVLDIDHPGRSQSSTAPRRVEDDPDKITQFFNKL